MQLIDLHTHEEHQLYVNRWLAVSEDDRQIIRELPVHRSPAGDRLPGKTKNLVGPPQCNSWTTDLLSDLFSSL